MKTKRLPRFKRQKIDKLPLVLTERDKEIIKIIYDHRFLTSHLIQALIPGSDQKILKRLQKLFHHGYLDRLKLKINQPIVYALANKGADLLIETYGIDKGKLDWQKKNKELKEFYLAHTLQIANFRITLTLALKNKPENEFLFWLPTGEFKQKIIFQEKEKKTKIPIIPDGFFGLRDKNDDMFFFLESDRSTMTNQRFLNKMKGYFQFWKYLNHQIKTLGHSPFQIGEFKIMAFRVLVITKSEARKENLRKITKQADDRKIGFEGFWFTSQTNYNLKDPQTILKPIWQTPKNDIYHHLLE